ncbi:hypothetical protein ABIE93_005950 [Bradyrhizobium elkanii]|uniref:hypothetical protein n=1 Tax=Bradyrhizobium elkanii TaxID=29448 RepID=UPI0035125431
MVKKAKKRASRAKSYMMVIRVSVPAKDVPHLKILDVYGLDKKGNLRDLDILNAYYDKVGQPSAMPDRS